MWTQYLLVTNYRRTARLVYEQSDWQKKRGSDKATVRSTAVKVTQDKNGLESPYNDSN
jgi:hypothetical protein